MARPYRMLGENCFYHITSRGDGRKRIFVSEYDYKKFLEYILKAKQKFKSILYAYVLMPNHYHLLAETTLANLSGVMHYINSSYTTYYNIKRRNAGHLFQGRYKSILVDKDSYFSLLTRYIHLNPVKAKLVQRPEEYMWSSYKGYISKKTDGYLDKDKINEILRMSTEQYRAFVEAGMEEEEENIFKNVYGGFLLGNTTFIKDRLKDLKGHIEAREVSHKKEIQTYIEKEDILKAVTKKYKIQIEEISRKSRRLTKERNIGMYLMKRLTSLSNREIGQVFGVSYSAVSKAEMSLEKELCENKCTKREVKRLYSQFKA